MHNYKILFLMLVITLMGGFQNIALAEEVTLHGYVSFTDYQIDENKDEQARPKDAFNNTKSYEPSRPSNAYDNEVLELRHGH